MISVYLIIRAYQRVERLFWTIRLFLNNNERLFLDNDERLFLDNLEGRAIQPNYCLFRIVNLPYIFLFQFTVSVQKN